MSSSLNWGIVATGHIAGTFARALKETRAGGKVLAVASRTQESADRFGQEYEVPRRYGSYQALLDDAEVQAVYISTPHPMHCEWVVKAAKAHKHILCEKPFAVNAREAETMVDAARASGVTLMEAFVYRCHPQTAKLIEILRRGVIGQVRVIQANYGFHCIYDAEGRLLNNSLGGGGILDMGCYPVSLTRLIAGVATGKDFADPIDLHACGHLGQTGVDEWTSAVCKFPGDIVAQWTTSVQCQLENGMRILGSEGRIHLPHAFHPAYWGGPSKIVVQFPGRTPQWDITVQADRPLFSIAIDAFAQHVREGQQQVTWPGIRWDDTIGNMRTTDRWRECIGLKYEADDATA